VTFFVVCKCRKIVFKFLLLKFLLKAASYYIEERCKLCRYPWYSNVYLISKTPELNLN
jgi:hypothetical protein